MAHLLVPFLVLLALSVFRRRLPEWVLSALLLCASVTACGDTLQTATAAAVVRNIPKDRVKEVCWKPAELPSNAEYYVFPWDSGTAVSELDGQNFGIGLMREGFVYKYNRHAPIGNLRLVPFNRPDAWCTHIPKPTAEAILELLHPCAGPASDDEALGVVKGLFGQTEVPIRSSIFCGKEPKVAMTPQEVILLRARNDAYQEAYDYARRVAAILTQADADMQRVVNESHWSLKRLFLSNPGSLEQIQQRLADHLNSIPSPPAYDDQILDGIAMAGFHDGFDNGQFDVQAKLFAIDAGIMILEVAAMELALGPLGGAKWVTSAVTKGGKALAQASTRLAEIPIFIPGAAGGAGAFIRAGALITSVSARMHRYYLEKALNAAPFNMFRKAGEAIHHIVSHSDPRAKISREVLDKFKVGIDAAWNGVFLPATKKSPNLTGAIVHSTVHSNKYFFKVEDFLRKATSRKDAIRRLQRIQETLKNGTFFDVPL